MQGRICKPFHATAGHWQKLSKSWWPFLSDHTFLVGELNRSSQELDNPGGGGEGAALEQNSKKISEEIRAQVTNKTFPEPQNNFTLP